MKTISAGELTVLLNEETLSVTVRHKHAEWSTLDLFLSCSVRKESSPLLLPLLFPMNFLKQASAPASAAPFPVFAALLIHLKL